MDYWAKPGLDRCQAVLFYPTLDDSIREDRPVRLLDEILRAQDWWSWEAEYHRPHHDVQVPHEVQGAVEAVVQTTGPAGDGNGDD